MEKKIVTSLLIISCLFSAVFLKEYKIPVKASDQNFVTWTVDDDKPANFTKIQDAILSPLVKNGDTIFVYNGTYVENIIVNKTVFLVGENREATIIDGNRTRSNVVSIGASNVSLLGFTIKGSAYEYSGIFIEPYTSSNGIQHNKIIGNHNGIGIQSSSNNTISDNIISNNYYGIFSTLSNNNTISDNLISLNSFDGIYLYYSSINVISNNIVDYNSYGIESSLSNNNSILDNVFSGNQRGLSFAFSDDNIIYHNNFDNIYSVSNIVSKNYWSYAEEGNYWSDYIDADLNSDGIGDSPYVIDQDNSDNFPLMGFFSSFKIALDTKLYYVSVICNLTVSEFKLRIGEETGNRIMQFNVSGGKSLIGFSRVTFLLELMRGPYIVLINNVNITSALLNVSDKAKACLYFAYLNTNSSITIISSEVRYLYNELSARYQELFENFSKLNETLSPFLNLYNFLLGNYSKLVEDSDALNASYQKHLSEHNEQLQNVQSLTYIFAAMTAVFMVTTIYLSRHAHSKTTVKTKPKEQGK